MRFARTYRVFNIKRCKVIPRSSMQNSEAIKGVFFLAHTLPNFHSLSDVYKENTLGNILKVTQLYPASDLGNGQECIG